LIKKAIEKVSKNEDLEPSEMVAVFNEIMSGEAEKQDVKEFLLSLKTKGESPAEIAAAANVMRERSTKVDTLAKDLIDTCGTGGAKISDVNISTIVAIVLAGCDVKVAKHGNRSFTGKCGSADILEELGINVAQTPERVAEMIEKIGIGFIFAPNFHPAMKNVMEIRRELATRTIFNILGPLSSPADVKMQILGVYDSRLTEVMAEALNKLGSEKAYIVHGLIGLDEISIKGETKVSELKNGIVTTYYISPQDFGIEEGRIEDILGGSREHNARVALDILNGAKGAPRDMVLINAAAALKMIGKVEGFKEGMRLVAKCIDSGKALEKLNALRDTSNR
jgi:anthranilate phosphoribosyltransferase